MLASVAQGLLFMLGWIIGMALFFVTIVVILVATDRYVAWRNSTRLAVILKRLGEESRKELDSRD